MDRKERLAAAVNGEKPDRVPVSAWGHFYLTETSAKGMADTMVDFFDHYDWDFLKIHARASFHVEGWGFEYAPSQDAGKLHVCTSHPIKTTNDWRKLKPLSLNIAPLAEQFEAIRLIKSRVDKDVPIIMTVFSPLDVAEKLIDRNAPMLKQHIEEDSDSIAAALDAISDTFARFMRELVATGIDGIYFSTKWANNVKLTSEQYQKLVRPYDMRVLEEARPFWANMLHLCEDQIQLDAMKDYPVQIMHWDDTAGHNPDYRSGQLQSGKAVGGGISPKLLAQGSPEDVLQAARKAITNTEGKGFILGPGCSVQVAKTSDANLKALRKAVELD